MLDKPKAKNAFLACQIIDLSNIIRKKTKLKLDETDSLMKSYKSVFIQILKLYQILHLILQRESV